MPRRIEAGAAQPRRVFEQPDGRPVVVELHDGDTFKLLDAGCDSGLFPWLRVAGVD
jgi:hypothetical protein